MLYVRKNIPSPFIYKELGTFPLIVHRLIKIFKYWLKVINLPDTNLVKYIYNSMVTDLEVDGEIVNWAALVKRMLEKHGLGYLWNHQHLLNKNDITITSLFKQRIEDIYLQSINTEIANVSNNRLYKHINSLFVNNAYLDNIKEKYIRVALSKFRLGSHNLMIERGRWRKLELVDRQCFNCGQLDDELHAITACKLFKNLRTKYLPKWLYTRPSMYKLIIYMDNVKGNELKNFGIFCHKVLDYIDKNII